VGPEEAGATGLEPAASGVTGRRSNQLNYAPAQGIVEFIKRGWPFLTCVGVIPSQGECQRHDGARYFCPRAYYYWIPAFAGMMYGMPSHVCLQPDRGITLTDSLSRFGEGWIRVPSYDSQVWEIGRETRRSCTTLSVVPHITLNDGNTIPQLGFGVFQIEPEDTAEAVREAIGVGYRHIDTAEMYGNEREVGEGIRASGIDRGEVYVTSKLNNGLHEPDDAREAFEGTLSDLGFNYVDLFLIHWPLPTLYDGDFVSTWRTLEEFHNDGRARSVGVSNFQVEHLERLAAETATVPSVNQIEVHPYFTNEAVREYGQDHGIATEAWSPIAQGAVLDDPTITQIAENLGKTPAQVVLRWHIQRGDIVFPKSVTPSRMRENFELFDFEIEPGDMDKISALDQGESGRTGPNPDTFAHVPG
jgi:2,5-diketo-D-gluconate reductase A